MTGCFYTACSKKIRSRRKGAFLFKGVFFPYALLYKRAQEVAHAIKEIPDIGNQVGIVLENSVSFFIAYFGISLAGKIIVPMKAGSAVREIGKVQSGCEIRLILTDEKHRKKMAQSDDLPFSLLCYDIDSGHIQPIHEEKGLAPLSEEERERITPDDVAIMLHTSGTTNDPKIVMLTHTNLVTNAAAVASSLGLIKEDKSLVFLPMHLSSANIQILSHLVAGASIVILDGLFTERRFFHMLKQEDITTLSCVTFVLNCMADHKEGKEDCPHLRQVGVGGGFVPEQVLKKVMERYPDTAFVHYYGQTEASPRITQHTVYFGGPIH